MFKHKKKVLFVLKYRQLYNGSTFSEAERKSVNTYFSSGLLNSANQVHQLLLDNKVQSKIVQVVDNNGIDREVHKFKPTHVIVEALWVVPEKFEVLQRLHPKVKWIIRLHSETPFMANEGVAMEWITKYINYRNVSIAVNSPRMLKDLQAIFPCNKHAKLMYLPNYYDLNRNREDVVKTKTDGVLDISSFSAIRPLKNTLLSAIAAILYAKEVGKSLRFHINASRIEGKGDNVLKNIRALFKGMNDSRFTLVEHGWLEPTEFRQLCATMDIGMQVSLSETHNIVALDHAAQDVPVVVSKEIPWASCLSVAKDANDILSIVKQMHIIMFLEKFKIVSTLNKICVRWYNFKTTKCWLNLFG